MKTMKYFVMLLCATLFFASCKDNDETTTVPVTGVTISKTTLALVVGSSETLTATVTPDDATEQAVAWSSDKTAIATVDAMGKVVAVAAGTATITVTTKDGAKTATCAVTVTPATIAVTGVTLNKPTLTLEEGAKETLTATIAPADATNKTVTWASDKTTVATVNTTTGEVTAVAAGTALITATTVDGAKTATCTVTVEAAKPQFGNEGQPGIDGSSWSKAYTITSKEEFILLTTRINGNETGWNTRFYKLTTDIDLGENNTEIWYPMGAKDLKPFKGYFDGDNHTIKGKFIADASANYFGLFGRVDAGEIKNIRFAGTIDASKMSGNAAGAIVGQLSTGSVVNCSNSANITANAATGGIVGSIGSGNAKIIACTNSGNIESTANYGFVGGISSDSSKGYIIGCINKGNPTGSYCVGGIVGTGIPTACWSSATAILRAGATKGCIAASPQSSIGATSNNCYWKPIAGINGWGTTAGTDIITNSAPFTGDKPDAAQISAMNATWATAQSTGREYQFNATTAEIEKIP